VKISPIFEASKIYADQEVVFLVGKSAKKLDEIIPKLSELGPVLCVGSLFGKVDNEKVDGFYFDDLRSINKAKEAVLDLANDFYASVPQARAYKNWKVFSGRIKGFTFDAGRICKNGGEHGGLFNLGAILGGKTLVLVGYDLLSKNEEKESEIITQLARWTAHYEISVISTDEETAIEAYEYMHLNEFIGTTTGEIFADLLVEDKADEIAARIFEDDDEQPDD